MKLGQYYKYKISFETAPNHYFLGIISLYTIHPDMNDTMYVNIMDIFCICLHLYLIARMLFQNKFFFSHIHTFEVISLGILFTVFFLITSIFDEYIFFDETIY